MKLLWAALLLCLLVLCLGACASIPTPTKNPSWRSDEATRRLRHRVDITIPDQPVLSFDGVMLESNRPERVRVVALGGFGLKLFDLVISRDAVEIIAIHGQIARLPHIVDHVASAVRRIWFDCLPAITEGQGAEGPACRGIRLADAPHPPGVSGVTNSTHPAVITLEDGRYTLTVRTLDEHPEE